MLPAPGLDALHRCLLQRQLAPFDQHATNGPVGTPVLIGVTDAYAAAIGKLDAGRALDVHEERFDRVVYPDELPPRQPCLTGLDFRARPIRQHALALESSANALGLELGGDLSQLDRA